MTVFIVMAGERYEGGHIESIHTTLDGAIEAARRVCREYRDGKWDEVEGRGVVMSWSLGCDWVTVTEHRLHGRESDDGRD